MSAAAVTLLGPQRSPSVGRVAQSLGVRGMVATITAGWQERESDDGELDELLDGTTRNLKLYERWVHVQEHDPEFAQAVRRRRHTLYELRETYLLRLAHKLAAVHELAPEGPDAVTQAENHTTAANVTDDRDDSDDDDDPAGFPDRASARAAERAYAREQAMADLRRLDAAHLARLDELNSAFMGHWRPDEREVVATHRSVITAILEEASAVAVAGGHVGALLATAHMFAIHLPADRPIIAWSAGAMLMTENVVLFHDRTPIGPSDAEMYGRGLALVPAVVAFPYARRRLLVSDRDRMSDLAQRFAPARSLFLDEGVRVDIAPFGSLPRTAPVLGMDGRVATAVEIT